MTKEQIETALAQGKLWALMRNGRYWVLRRNGATKLWKTRPSEFRIPVKAGLRSYGYVDNNSAVSNSRSDNTDFLISETNPN